jgi:hypothetical protein
MKLAVLLFMSLSLMLSSEANAVTGIGDRSCAKWVHDRDAAKQINASPDDIWEELADDSWLLGFLTGVAVESYSNYLEQPDVDFINVWVDNYCAQHPRHNLAVASHQLYLDLSAKMNQFKVSR